MKVYIAGKITGDPDYKYKFAKVERELALAGHAVMNPARHGEYAEFDHEDYCEVDNAMIKVCEACFFLKDWTDSPGAKMERQLASRLGKKIFDQTDDGWEEAEPLPLPQKKSRKKWI